MLHDAGGERARGFVTEKLHQRRARDAATPELAPDPVADAALGAVGPRPDVPGDSPAGKNGAERAGGVGHDFLPVGQKRPVVARGKRRHPRACGIALVLEKHGQVAEADLAEGDPGRGGGRRVHGSGRKALTPSIGQTRAVG